VLLLLSLSLLLITVKLAEGDKQREEANCPHQRLGSFGFLVDRLGSCTTTEYWILDTHSKKSSVPRVSRTVRRPEITHALRTPVLKPGNKNEFLNPSKTESNNSQDAAMAEEEEYRSVERLLVASPLLLIVQPVVVDTLEKLCRQRTEDELERSDVVFNNE
jgi:hypothetical protein